MQFSSFQDDIFLILVQKIEGNFSVLPQVKKFVTFDHLKGIFKAIFCFESPDGGGPPPQIPGFSKSVGMGGGW